MRYIITAPMITALALLPLAACSVFDPYQREGTWRPYGANDANLAAQSVRPSDLVRGVDYAPTDGSMTTAAASRYRSGRIRHLPDSSIASIRVQGSGGNDAGAPDPTAAGGTAPAAQ